MVAPLDPVVEDLLSRCRFPPTGTSVACAVSGGPDSTALLVLAVRAGCRATAIHVDHGLRPGSAAEADLVARTADRLGADFESRTVHLEAGPNLEARARAARYAALPPGVLTGHTMDDQAETVLLALMRGAGLRGLAGMDPATRPLLGLRRAETVQLCVQEGLDVVVDESNSDLGFRRNRVRHQLLPLMAEIAERDPVPVIARQAELLAADDELLDQLAEPLDPTRARELAGAPLPLARRAVRRWLRGEHPPSAAEVSRVLAVARGEVRATEVSAGRRVERRAGGRMVLSDPDDRRD